MPAEWDFGKLRQDRLESQGKVGMTRRDSTAGALAATSGRHPDQRFDPALHRSNTALPSSSSRTASSDSPR